MSAKNRPLPTRLLAFGQAFACAKYGTEVGPVFGDRIICGERIREITVELPNGEIRSGWVANRTVGLLAFRVTGDGSSWSPFVPGNPADRLSEVEVGGILYLASRGSTGKTDSWGRITLDAWTNGRSTKSTTALASHLQRATRVIAYAARPANNRWL